MTDKVRDPVCKMEIQVAAAVDSVTHQGKKYYFCSEPCADQFQANPGRFVNTAGEV